MSVALVTGQHAMNHGTAGSPGASLAVSLPSPVTAGNMVAVFGTGFTYTPAANELADNQGNSYSLDAQQAYVNGVQFESVSIWTVQNAASNGGTFTATWTFSGNQAGVLYIAEFSGVATSSALDQSVAGNPSNGTTWSSTATGTQAATGNLALAATSCGGNNNPEGLHVVTSGWTDLDLEDDGTQFTVSMWSWKEITDQSAQTVQWGANFLESAPPYAVTTYLADTGPAVSGPTLRTVRSTLGW